ncbi:MAG: sigma-54 dependent transcriptional regulator [Bacteroidaceae bacterium]|nr:sigma-54 dependent transcriptional regulator [Bacteroidaceae bacterium]
MVQSPLQEIKQRYRVVGNSDELNRALDIAVQVARTNLSVLIVGESGVGKEIIPRIIHDNSVRKHQNYFAINCGSIPEGTIDSELFGHEKGAFTGAVAEREGYFGAANNGTLFLDEVGELPLATQARLLRVLETGEYIRVGSSEVRKTNVRIVAATNVNLQNAISEGRFREDLYFRLATIPIKMPPLRSRGQDIELLFRKFANDIAEEYNIAPIRLTDDGKALLMSYRWPGNIRQLKNVVEQLSIISPERMITAEMLRKCDISDDNEAGTGLILAGKKADFTHSYENERDMLFHVLSSLGKEVKEIKAMLSMSQPSVIQSYSSQDVVPAEEVTLLDDAVLIDKNSIEKALKHNKGNRSKAAKELGISERTMYRRLKEYGLA